MKYLIRLYRLGKGKRRRKFNENFGSVADSLRNAASKIAKAQQATSPPEVRRAPVTAAPQKSVTPLLRRPAATGNSDLTAPERRILTVLAQRSNGLEIDSLAMLAGYTVNGHFNNQLGQLRARGLVTPPRVTPIAITEDGINELGDFEPLPTGEDLQRYWLQKLSAPEAKILGVLLNHYPDPIDIDQLASEAGYTINGHFNNQVGQLRTKGLMSGARMPILASEEFFE